MKTKMIRPGVKLPSAKPPAPEPFPLELFPPQMQEDLDAHAAGNSPVPFLRRRVYFPSPCHPQATQVSYHQGSGVLSVECARCGRLLIRIQVARRTYEG